MRCVALAQAWADGGGRVAFLYATMSSSLQQRIQAEGFECSGLVVQPGSQRDAEATSEQAQRHGSRMVVVDGYHFRADFRSHLRRATLKVISIDDNGESDTSASDLIINQNRHATAALYSQHAPGARLLLGTDYALLRREFRCLTARPREFQAGAAHVLVTLGAADPDNVTARVTDALAATLEPGTETRIVVGGSNRHAVAVGAAAGRLRGARIIDDPGMDMPELMAWADFAVCAGGGTMWELAYLGVPFIPVIIAENQRLAALAMGRDGYLVVDSTTLERDLPAAVRTLVSNAENRKTLSQLGRRLVDGMGAKRVCQVLRQLAD